MNNKRNFFLIIILFILVISLFNILQANNKLDKKVVVFAASSLRPILDNLFLNQVNDLVIQYNGSQYLKYQLENGAQADFLFCAGSDECLPDVNKESFCSNELVLAIDSKINLQTLTEVLNADIKLARAADNVPLGKMTAKFINSIPNNDSLLLNKKFVTFDLSASSVLARLETNQVDGAFIYRSYFYNDNNLKNNFNYINLSSNQKLVYFYQQLHIDNRNNEIIQQLQLIDDTRCEEFGYIK